MRCNTELEKLRARHAGHQYIEPAYARLGMAILTRSFLSVEFLRQLEYIYETQQMKGSNLY